MQRWLARVTVLTVLFGMLAVAVPAVSSPASAHGDRTNGCSVPFNPPWKDTPGGFYFHSACDGHDRNYINRPYGANEWDRATSDWFFLRAMRESCRSYPWALSACYDWAWRCYSQVRAWGWLFYYRSDKYARADVRVA